MSNSGYVPLSPIRATPPASDHVASGNGGPSTEERLPSGKISSKSSPLSPISPRRSPDIQILAPTPQQAHFPYLPYSLPPPATSSTHPSYELLSSSPAHATNHPPLAIPPWLPLALHPSPRVAAFIQNNVGLLLVASSQIFFVGMGLTAKYFVSTTEISTLVLILVRMVMTAGCCICWLLFTGDPDWFLGPPEIRKWLVWRGIFGFGGLASNYQSLRGLSVSDSVTIQFLAPNLTALMGFLVLGETLGWREIVAGLTCLCGVMLVSRPPFLFGGTATTDPPAPDDTHPGTSIPEEGNDAGIDHADRVVAVTWAFVAVLSASAAYITIRKIGKQAHAMHSMLWFCHICVVACLVGLLFQIRNLVFVNSWTQFWLIILIGVFGFSGQMLLTLGLQREKAGRASLAMYLSLFYSIFLELIIFGTIPPFLSLLGASIIISSAVWVAVTKKNEFTPISNPRGSHDAAIVSRTASPIVANGGTKRSGVYDYSSVPDSDPHDSEDGISISMRPFGSAPQRESSEHPANGAFRIGSPDSIEAIRESLPKPHVGASSEKHRANGQEPAYAIPDLTSEPLFGNSTIIKDRLSAPEQGGGMDGRHRTRRRSSGLSGKSARSEHDSEG